MKTVPIKKVKGLELATTAKDNVSRVNLCEHNSKPELSFDRYLRLSKVKEALDNLPLQSNQILDVGGFDGAIKFFIPELDVDLIDPSTTGGCIFDTDLEENSYESVVSVDVLEHIVPSDRKVFLEKISAISSNHVLLNYPNRGSIEAQKLVFNLTGNTLIEEHVKWELPDTDWVIECMLDFGFTCDYKLYGNTAVWLSQYLVLNKMPDVAEELCKYLIENHLDEPASNPLYVLVVCKRNSNA